MPMEARSDLGSFGFSANSFMYPSSPVARMPKREAYSMETCITEMVQAASCLTCSRSMSE